MSVIGVTTDIWQFNRGRTIALLDDIAALPSAQDVLGWRPGPGRAHIAWQLMHVGVTEELFATARISGTTPEEPETIERYRGGSTPDDDIPTVEEIRTLLDSSRAHLLQTFSEITDDDLDRIPEPLQERGWSLGTVLQVLAWHEPHHQGQAHITLNLWKAQAE